jgi:hypothetical protein
VSYSSPEEDDVTFARRAFTWASYYGICVLGLLYFLEDRIGREDPPAITHPEYFYGFIGVALTFQLVYWTIGRDPVRFRPIMPFAILAKAGFFTTVAVLVALGRAKPIALSGPSTDLALAVVFLIAYLRTPVEAPGK